MREYKVIGSASSVEQLRLRLKQEEIEQYGEPFTPEFVYDVIRRLPRFSSMRVRFLSRGRRIILVSSQLTLNSVVTSRTQKSSLGSCWRDYMMSVSR